MTYSLYQIVTIASLVASTVISVIGVAKGNFSLRYRAKANIVERLKLLSDGIREFYEKFNPPMRVESEKDVWSHWFSLIILVFLGFMFFFGHRYAFGLTVIAIAIVGEFAVLPTIYELHIISRVTKLTSKFEKKSGSEQHDKLIIEAKKVNWYLMRFTVGEILSVVFINVFIVSNLTLESTPVETMGLYAMIFVATSYIILLQTYLYHNVYREIEFVSIKEYIADYKKSIMLDLILSVPKGQATKISGEFLSLYKFLYLKREDDSFQEVNFKGIELMSVRETA